VVGGPTASNSSGNASSKISISNTKSGSGRQYALVSRGNDGSFAIQTQDNDSYNNPITPFYIDSSDNVNIGTTLQFGTAGTSNQIYINSLGPSFPAGSASLAAASGLPVVDVGGNNAAYMRGDGVIVVSNTSGSPTAYMRGSDGTVETLNLCIQNACKTSWTDGTFSDIRLKKDIQPLQDALAKIMELKPVSFEYINPGYGKGTQLGLIAQDVEKIYPQVVETDASTTLKSIDYGNLVSPLIKAVQEQQTEIEDLKAQIAELKANK
jgi:hypothetical protein